MVKVFIRHAVFFAERWKRKEEFVGRIVGSNFSSHSGEIISLQYRHVYVYSLHNEDDDYKSIGITPKKAEAEFWSSVCYLSIRRCEFSRHKCSLSLSPSGAFRKVSGKKYSACPPANEYIRVQYTDTHSQKDAFEEYRERAIYPAGDLPFRDRAFVYNPRDETALRIDMEAAGTMPKTVADIA